MFARRLKQHGKAQIAKLAAGIDRHGFNVPILVDERCKLVAGQARLDAALLLRLDQVPVIRIAHLIEEQLRLATSTGGTLTGKGGDLIIIDDPLKADDAYSETARGGFYEWATQTLFTRLDEKTKGSIILVQQRQHEDDLSGHMLRTEEWLHISLPAIAAEEERFVLSTTPLRSHLRRVGDLLDPVRKPLEVLQSLKRQIGTAAFEAQYQQAPMPPDGDLIKLSWFRTYDALPEDG